MTNSARCAARPGPARLEPVRHPERPAREGAVRQPGRTSQGAILSGRFPPLGRCGFAAWAEQPNVHRNGSSRPRDPAPVRPGVEAKRRAIRPPDVFFNSVLPRIAASARQRRHRPATQLAPSQASETNPNHHLWKNGRLWWLAVTLLHDGWRQERVRQSLGTDDVLEARRRRDLVLARFARPAVATPCPRRSSPRTLLRGVDARLAVLGERHHLVGGLEAVR